MAAKKNEKKEEASEATQAKAEALATTATGSGQLAAVEDYSQFTGAGETLNKDDIMIARYRVVQKMTRAIKVNRELAEGQFYNTLTKKGQKRALVVVMLEQHHIVERTDDTQGKFVGTMALDDKRVLQARKANGQSLIKLKSIDKDPPTKFVETRDVHVCFLDETDGITPLGFGVLQFDSTNLTPAKVWKNERAAALRNPKDKTKPLPVFMLRSIVTTEVKDNSQSNQPDSMIFKIEPYLGNYKASALKPSVPEELELLTNLADHRDLILSGVLQVDYTGEEEETEEETEGNDFDPDDDGRPAAHPSSSSPAPAAAEDAGEF